MTNLACAFLQSPDGDVIDCVPAHLQPAFEHPKLRGQKPEVGKVTHARWRACGSPPIDPCLKCAMPLRAERACGEAEEQQRPFLRR